MTIYKQRIRHYYALLGFADYCSVNNKRHAQVLGKLCAQKQLGLAVGNTSGTFSAALESCHKNGGHSLAVLEAGVTLNNPNNIDIIDWQPSQCLKHHLLACMADAAIIIGGGSGSALLAQELLKLNKPVTAIRGTGGIVEDALDKEIIVLDNVREAFDICSKNRCRQAANDSITDLWLATPEAYDKASKH